VLAMGRFNILNISKVNLWVNATFLKKIAAYVDRDYSPVHIGIYL